MCGLPSHHDGRGSRTTGAKHSQVSSPPTLPSLSKLHSSFPFFSPSLPLFPSLYQFVNSICDSLPFFQFSLFLRHLFSLPSHLPLSFLLFPDPLPSPFFHSTLIGYLLPLSTPPSPSFLPLPPFLPPVPPPSLSLSLPPGISSSLARCHSMLVTMQ